MWDFRVTVRNRATGEEAVTTSRASDPDDACCLDEIGELPETWGDDPDLEVLAVEMD